MRRTCGWKQDMYNKMRLHGIPRDPDIFHFQTGFTSNGVFSSDQPCRYGPNFWKFIPHWPCSDDRSKRLPYIQSYLNTNTLHNTLTMYFGLRQNQRLQIHITCLQCHRSYRTSLLLMAAFFHLDLFTCFYITSL
jgi:hypothetical protein